MNTSVKTVLMLHSFHSPSAAALAEDHFNDVLSNTAALITASIAFHTSYWWMDPLGRVLFRLMIITLVIFSMSALPYFWYEALRLLYAYCKLIF